MSSSLWCFSCMQCKYLLLWTSVLKTRVWLYASRLVLWVIPEPVNNFLSLGYLGQSHGQFLGCIIRITLSVPCYYIQGKIAFSYCFHCYTIYMYAYIYVCVCPCSCNDSLAQEMQSGSCGTSIICRDPAELWSNCDSSDLQINWQFEIDYNALLYVGEISN